MKNIVEIILKIVIITTLLTILFYTFNSNYVYADDFNPDIYKPDPAETDVSGETTIQKLGLAIVGPVRLFGSFMSVFAIMIIGIKYMLGSVEEKAEYKKTLLPYFIGAIIVFGIINIVGFIYDIATNI